MQMNIEYQFQLKQYRNCDLIFIVYWKYFASFLIFYLTYGCLNLSLELNAHSSHSDPCVYKDFKLLI